MNPTDPNLPGGQPVVTPPAAGVPEPTVDPAAQPGAPGVPPMSGTPEPAGGQTPGVPGAPAPLDPTVGNTGGAV